MFVNSGQQLVYNLLNNLLWIFILQLILLVDFYYYNDHQKLYATIEQQYLNLIQSNERHAISLEMAHHCFSFTRKVFDSLAIIKNYKHSLKIFSKHFSHKSSNGVKHWALIAKQEKEMHEFMKLNLSMKIYRYLM